MDVVYDSYVRFEFGGRQLPRSIVEKINNDFCKKMAQKMAHQKIEPPGLAEEENLRGILRNTNST